MPDKILMIDDEEEACRYTKTVLERTGKFEVMFLTQPYGVIGITKNYKPQVILLDIMLPEKDGTEIAHDLSLDSFTRNIPIVFLTALAQKDEVENNMGTIGGCEFLAKPISSKELIAKIESVLARTKIR